MSLGSLSFGVPVPDCGLYFHIPKIAPKHKKTLIKEGTPDILRKPVNKRMIMVKTIFIKIRKIEFVILFDFYDYEIELKTITGMLIGCFLREINKLVSPLIEKLRKR